MKFLKAIPAFIIIFCIVFTLLYGKDKIINQPPISTTAEYRGVLSMWQIDNFEGGTGSRKEFLLSCARTYEKRNDGLFIMVSNYTLDGVKENFDKGIYPDIISYGCGVELKNTAQLTLLRTVKGGKIGDKTFATAWCMGGYVLFANPTLTSGFEDVLQNLTVSQNEYTEPLLALHEAGYTAKDITVLKPMDAYVKFTQGKTPYFLGTQRDVIRFERRGMEVNAKPLTIYNDLYQYVSVTSSDQVKRSYAIDFVEFLCSDTVQNSLSEIGMLSPYVKVSYQNPTLVQMQSADYQTTVSAFSSKELLKELQSLSLSAITGNADDKTKIKNVLI